jgi:hypothetical protein
VQIAASVKLGLITGRTSTAIAQKQHREPRSASCRLSNQLSAISVGSKHCLRGKEQAGSMSGSFGRASCPLRADLSSPPPQSKMVISQSSL